jgi:hypothetical protein
MPAKSKSLRDVTLYASGSTKKSSKKPKKIAKKK